MKQLKLIASFRDTFSYANGEQLVEATKMSINSNRVYKELFASDKAIQYDVECPITVEASTTFAEAKKYTHLGRVAVLNFANPVNPGGGVKNGAMAQEECLCRSSNLYPCLADENVQEEYYRYNSKLKSNYFSDRVLYTRDVTVFKTDDAVPQMMPQNEWFLSDVITCAAPYLAREWRVDYDALKHLFKGRIKNIFETAIENEVQVLILGAFGCGAFKNPPELVAEAFAEVIRENGYARRFKKIVFAIKPTGAHCPNLQAFKSKLHV